MCVSLVRSQKEIDFFGFLFNFIYFKSKYGIDMPNMPAT